MRLFWLEFKRLTTSLTFLIYAVIVFAFIMLNAWSMVNSHLSKIPQPGSGDYDYIISKDDATLKTNALDQLKLEHHSNEYETYPAGFEKIVSLNKQKQAKVKLILNQAEKARTKAMLARQLQDVDHLLGGHSAYSHQNLQGFSFHPMTRREALHDHQLIMTKDKISGTFARFFADIAGIIVGVLPTIVVISYCYSDRRSKALPNIQAKFTSTGKWLITRYAASLLSLILPVFLTGILFTVKVANLYSHFSINYFAFLQATVFWVLPTLMVSTAVGFLSYAIFANFIGFAIQIGWWLITMTIGARQVSGNYGWLFIPRHNSLHNVAYYYNHLGQLTLNRIGYTLIALALMGLAIVIFNFQRGGKSYAFKFKKINYHRHSGQ
ncbi:MAG: ABC transporter permease [Lentilactobacillus hilgardii]|uniref:ABC transporter permease n=3 Tax=Lentilactobacillus hilgardii TaxID=1588 RepID=UPI001CC1D9C0|nr:ABC transporter permease [Lentilactobacillus hilgardii]MBZ2200560.1 ABC transporter permease [Lentilactobacillus hilgardii]